MRLLTGVHEEISILVQSLQCCFRLRPFRTPSVWGGTDPAGWLSPGLLFGHPRAGWPSGLHWMGAGCALGLAGRPVSRQPIGRAVLGPSAPPEVGRVLIGHSLQEHGLHLRLVPSQPSGHNIGHDHRHDFISIASVGRDDG